MRRLEIEDLYQIALRSRKPLIDPARAMTVLSSGAGMSVALAVAQNEYFAAAGSVAGLPYSEKSGRSAFSA